MKQGGSEAARQARRRLINPDEISRRNDPEGRNALARSIREIRAQRRALLKLIQARETRAEQIAREKSRLTDLIARNKETLAKRMQTIGVRMRRLLNLRDSSAKRSEAEIAAREAEMTRLNLEAESIREEIIRLNEERQQIDSPQSRIREYRERFETTPLTNQEKRELLRPEVLSTLSTEEYIALWRRLNPHFLSHVTRQGFRGHVSHHSAGHFEFHNGFTKILHEGGALRPAMSVREGLFGTDPAAVRRFLQDWVLKAGTEAEALDRLDSIINAQTAAAPRYADRTSVHFAAQEVSDFYYGGEKNNEVFFLFPTDVLASQNDFALNGGGTDLTQAPKDSQWNDVFVWPESLDNPNISINSGIVFLPGDIPVDPNTGSKYYFEEQVVDGKPKRVLVEDPKLTSAFIEWTSNLNNDSPAIKAYREFLSAREQAVQERRTELPSPKAVLEALAQEIRQLGFAEDAVNDLAEVYFDKLSSHTSLAWRGQAGDQLSWRFMPPETLATQVLKSTNANMKRAQNAIPAREYWNNYFAQNPQLKPAHIVFYNGDPTTAVARFQRENHIGLADVTPTEGNLLGFSDRHVENMGEDPRANKGKNELLDTARALIAEHYASQERQGETAASPPEQPALASRVAREMHLSGFSETPPPKVPADSPGWIDTAGQIFYNPRALNSVLAPGHAIVDSAPGQGIRIRRPDKSIVNFGEYRRLMRGTPHEGTSRALLARMTEIKNHESMHRVTTLLKDPASLFARRDGQKPLPEGKVELTDINGNPLSVTAKNVDEFISRVADGTQPIDPAQRAILERAIAKEIPGFTFDRVRQVDTRLLATNPREAFRRAEAAAKDRQPERINLLPSLARQVYQEISSGKVGLDLSNPIQQEALRQNMDPRDYEVLLSNPDLSREVQVSVMRGGLDVSQTMMLNNQPVEKRMRIYAGAFIGQGAYGQVSHVAYLETGESKLRFGVMKIPHASEHGIQNFSYERENALAIAELHANWGAYAQSVIRPILVGDRMILYEKISDSNGRTMNLDEGMGAMSTGEWIRQFAGGVEGLATMHEAGITHNDFKPANLVAGPNGGVLIDIGSTVSLRDITNGRIIVSEHEGFEHTYYRSYNQAAGRWEFNRVAQDPAYNDSRIMADAVQNGKPIDQCDKLAVGNSIFKFLRQRGHLNSKGELRPGATYQIFSLYQVFLKLMDTRNHPSYYLNGNPAAGVDPQFVSTRVVSQWLRHIGAMEI